MEQYLALIQYNIRPGIVKPEIDSDVKFKINGNFMSKLRLKLFKGIDDENAHEHVRRVLEIVDLFHLPSITHDAVMLRVLPITLSGPALRRKNNLSAGLITKWDLLEKVFISNIVRALKTAMKLGKNSNFQTIDWFETLYHAWERYNDLLFRWAHPTNDCPLTKEDKVVEQSKYIRSLEEIIIKFYKESIKKQAADDEWIKKFIKNTDSNIRVLKTTTKNMQEKADQLTQTTLTNSSERVKAKTKIGHLKKQKDEPYKTREIVGIPEEIHTKKAQEEEGDMDDGWDITIKDVESLRQILIPSIHTLPNLEHVVQLYMSQGPVRDETVHITPLDDDYVASATSPILEKHLNKLGEEIYDITRVVEKADGNLDLNSKETKFEIISTHNHMV
ncbi:hypothetical protein Tco_0190698 [Tanacetum coccineum]